MSEPSPEVCTAWHEAGHAVMVYHYQGWILEASILPDHVYQPGGRDWIASAGRVQYLARGNRQSQNTDLAIAQSVQVSLAGLLAETMIRPDGMKWYQEVVVAFWSGRADECYRFPDYENAIRAVEKIERLRISSERMAFVVRQEKVAREMLDQHRHRVELMANELLAKKRMSGKAIRRLFRAASVGADFTPVVDTALPRSAS
jgi:ATP-dependent Zn protease